MNPRTHDFGAYCTTVSADVPVQVASSADGSESDGTTVDRNSLARTVYRSAKVSIPFVTTLSSGANAIVIANVQDSPTSTAWTDYGSTGIGSTITNASTVSALVGNNVLEFDVDLGAADRYVRTQLTVTMDDAAGDTTDVAAIWVFGGPPVLPADGL